MPSDCLPIPSAGEPRRGGAGSLTRRVARGDARGGARRRGRGPRARRPPRGRRAGEALPFSSSLGLPSSPFLGLPSSPFLGLPFSAALGVSRPARGVERPRAASRGGGGRGGGGTAGGGGGGGAAGGGGGGGGGDEPEVCLVETPSDPLLLSFQSLPIPSNPFQSLPIPSNPRWHILNPFWFLHRYGLDARLLGAALHESEEEVVPSECQDSLRILPTPSNCFLLFPTPSYSFRFLPTPCDSSDSFGLLQVALLRARVAGECAAMREAAAELCTVGPALEAAHAVLSTLPAEVVRPMRDLELSSVTAQLRQEPPILPTPPDTSRLLLTPSAPPDTF